MSGFLLLTIHPTLLERVTNKLEEDSYFRIQQTCSDVYNFIRTNPNISVHIKELECYRRYDRNIQSWSTQQIEKFYGTRLEWIEVAEYKMEIEGFCNTLEKNRITCDRLQLIPSGTMPWMAPAGQIQHWTTEQCVKLFKIVKPVKISLNFEESDRIEAAQETAKGRHTTEPGQGTHHDPETPLHVSESDNSPDNRLGCIPLGPYNPGYSPLHAFPELRQLPRLHLGRVVPSKEELEAEFGDWVWEEEMEFGRKIYFTTIALPEHFPADSFCTLAFSKDGRNSCADLYYGVKDA